MLPSKGIGSTSSSSSAVERLRTSHGSVICYPEFTVALPRLQEFEGTGSPMIGVMDCRPQHLGQSWAGVPPESLEFFDRPLLHHAVEQMIQGGVTHCTFIAEDASAVMKRLGTGEQWGCTFSAISPSEIGSFLCSLADVPLLVGVGNCVPSFGALGPTGSRLQTKLFFASLAREATIARLFTGWAVATPQVLIGQRFAEAGAVGLLDAPDAADADVPSCIHSGTPSDFLASQAACLDAPESELIFHATELRPGLWVARNVFMESDVNVSGTVYLGENVRVAKGVTLAGPLAIGKDSVIDAEASIAEASVQPRTYVGRNMQLHRDVVLPGAVIHASSGMRVEIGDPRKLASTSLTLWGYLRSLFGGTRENAA